MEELIKKDLETLRADENQHDKIIPVIKEEVVTGKRIVKKGRIIIEKKVNEEEITVEVPLMTEQAEIQRVTVNQYIETSPEVRYEGDTIIIPVIKEVMVKKLLLVEEIRVTKHVHTFNKTENITIREEEVKITRKEE